MPIDIKYDAPFPFLPGMVACVMEKLHYTLLCSLIYWPLDFCVCLLIQSFNSLWLECPVGQACWRLSPPTSTHRLRVGCPILSFSSFCEALWPFPLERFLDQKQLHFSSPLGGTSPGSQPFLFIL